MLGYSLSLLDNPIKDKQSKPMVSIYLHEKSNNEVTENRTLTS